MWRRWSKIGENSDRGTWIKKSVKQQSEIKLVHRETEKISNFQKINKHYKK